MLTCKRSCLHCGTGGECVCVRVVTVCETDFLLMRGRSNYVLHLCICAKLDVTTYQTKQSQ